MQKQLEKIEIELAQRIYKLFLIKFDGNKSAFARASMCNETTIRRIFRNEQGITFNLLLIHYTKNGISIRNAVFYLQ